jgi:hypothetical protein
MSTSPLIEPAWVWLRRLSLDRRLAHGADPATDTRLARRARQLTSLRCRTGLVEGIHSILDEARLLQAIARDLTEYDELSPRGIALVHARAALHLS